MWRIEKRNKSDGSLDWVVNYPAFSTVSSIMACAITSDATGIYLTGTDYDVGSGKTTWVVQKRSLVDGSIIWNVSRPVLPSSNHYPKSISLASDGIWISGSIGDDNITTRTGLIEKRNLTTGALILTIYTSAAGGALLDGVDVYGSNIYLAGAKRTTGDWAWYMAALGPGFDVETDDLMHHLKWFADEEFQGFYLFSRARYHGSTPILPVHTILSPVVPSGTTKGIKDVTYSYSIAFTKCDPAHNDQIKIDWGDVITDWIDASSSPLVQTHTWSTIGTYTVKAKAKCLNTGLESSWSDSISVVIGENQDVNPDAIPITWNTQITLTIQADVTMVFVGSITEDGKSGLRWSLYGITQTLMADVLWTFPDGSTQVGSIVADEVASSIQLYSPVPTGNYYCRVRGTQVGSFILRTILY